MQQKVSSNCKIQICGKNISQRLHLPPPPNYCKEETPRLLDEWLDAPVLWDTVRTMVDKRSLPGQFILTGSNSIDRDSIHHSSTGRISKNTDVSDLFMGIWRVKR